MRIRDLVIEAHKTAVSKGWWDDCLMQGIHPHPLEISSALNLAHGEVSEATEELRKGPPCYQMYFVDEKPVSFDHEPPPKPEGLVVELADTVIRIFDLCGKMGLDLEGAIMAKMAYNKTRKHKHGGKVI